MVELEQKLQAPKTIKKNGRRGLIILSATALMVVGGTIGGERVVGSQSIVNGNGNGNGVDSGNNRVTKIVFTSDEQRQLQDLSRFINSVVESPYNKFNIGSEVVQRTLLDQSRVYLINGTRWRLDWNEPSSILGMKLPFAASNDKLEFETSLITKGKGNNVDEYRLKVRGMDTIDNLNLNNPAKISPRSLHKASHMLFNLPTNLQWHWEDKDGVIKGMARGIDNNGNTIEYTINGAGIAELVVSR